MWVVSLIVEVYIILKRVYNIYKVKKRFMDSLRFMERREGVGVGEENLGLYICLDIYVC